MRVSIECVRSVASKAFREPNPCVAHAVDLKRGEVEVFGPEITYSDPIVRADGLDCRVKFGKVGSPGSGDATDKYNNETCNAGNPDGHDSHRILTGTRLVLWI